MDTTAHNGTAVIGGNGNGYGNASTVPFAPLAPGRESLLTDLLESPAGSVPEAAVRPDVRDERREQARRRVGGSPSTRRLADLSVRKRLLGLVGVIGLLWVACLGVATSGLLSSRSNAVQANTAFGAFQTERNAYEGWLTDDDQSNMVSALASLHEASQQQLLGATWQQVVQGHGQAVAALTTLQRSATDLVVRQEATHTLADLATYNSFTNAMHAAVVRGNTRLAIDIMSIKNAPISNATQADFNVMSARLASEVTSVKGHVLSSVSSALLLLVVLALIAALLTGLAVRWVIRSIMRPLATIGATLEGVTAGNLEVRAEVTSRDELGHVAETLNEAIAAQALARDALSERSRSEAESAGQLQARVEQILRVVNAAARGDLTVGVPVSGADPIGQVGESLAGFLGDLRSRMSTIGENSQGLAGAAEELTATSSQMSAGAEETHVQANLVSETSEVVSANVQTVAAAAEELTASIREIAKNAADAARVATMAAEVAETTNATISKLGDSSAEIGKVIKVITSIAQQTNLLALNATIEAARAGEAGKGFAVVANEVKDLARETAIASEDISAKIEAIQADTSGAVEAIGKISEIIGNINDIQHTIASAVEEQTATTNEIARNVSIAAQGASDITGNVNGVAQVAQSTLNGAADTERAAGELARMASDLQRLVGEFSF